MWQAVIHLIEDPTLIRAELDRRLDATRDGTDKAKARSPRARADTDQEKARNGCLRPTRKISCPSTNCAVGCRNCAPASSLCARNGRRSSIRPPTKYHSSDLRNPGPHSSSGYASRRKRWKSLSGQVVRLLVKEVLVIRHHHDPATRSRPNHQLRPSAARRYRQTANSGSALKVTFCVRGVLSPLLANLCMRRFVLGGRSSALSKASALASSIMRMIL